MYTKQEIENKMKKVNFWWHQIDLGQGIITPGKSDTQARLERIHLPEDLSGKAVLDVGCWDGFFSFICEKRGAKKVLATDHFIWHEPWAGMDGFLTVREILGSQVDYMDIDVFDITPENVGYWDIVLFLGVYYHLKNPCLALERLAKVTKSLLIVESMVIDTGLDEDVPIMRFYPSDECSGDSTNWWGPNLECLKRTMLDAGFQRVEVKSYPNFYFEPKWKKLLRNVRNKFKAPNEKYLSSGRAVVHGWKQAD